LTKKQLLEKEKKERLERKKDNKAFEVNIAVTDISQKITEKI